MSGEVPVIGICFSEVSGVRLALDAERVHAIAEHAGKAAHGAQCVDVVEALELPPLPGHIQRRAVVLGAGREAPRVVLGERVDIGAVAPAELQCLPPLLAALELRPGIMGVIQRADGLWLMLDADRLLSRRAEMVGEKERDDG
jgi:hypothetical protein